MTVRVLPALLLAVALVAGGCSNDDYVAPRPPGTSDVADPVTAAATVAALQDAIATGDGDAAGALGADADASTLLAALVANAGALRLGDVTLRYVTETGRTSGSDGWDGQVALTWRVEGFDAASARTEVPFSFADGGATIAAVGAGQGRLPLWLGGPLDVRRAGQVLVAAAEPAQARRYLPAARRALEQVRAVVGGDTGLVVEVPADSAGLHRALGVEPGRYDTIAAITAPVDGVAVEGSPIHVFLDRPVYDGLDPVAAQVVMTHEAVHAVTAAPLAQRAPMWLVEGFADYVALRDIDLPTSRTAGQIARQVRADGLPDALPATSDFDPAASHLGAVYEAAWLVCVTLADHRGEGALVDLYRQVLEGDDFAAALRAGFGWSERDLTSAWRDRLADVADVGR
ncbi:hypothetical protein ACFJIY_01515 [Pimelobacter simplex]|uniref:hypothetical protein n=1 Tax=Nocardioides simplex TaxID=2045 RepID=UPI00367185C0